MKRREGREDLEFCVCAGASIGEVSFERGNDYEIGGLCICDMLERCRLYATHLQVIFSDYSFHEHQCSSFRLQVDVSSRQVTPDLNSAAPVGYYFMLCFQLNHFQVSCAIYA